MKDLKKKFEEELKGILEDEDFIKETRHEVVEASVIPAISLITSTTLGVVTAIGVKKIFKL